MSILSRFLKRDDEPPPEANPAPGGAGAGAVPAAEFPAHAEKTDANEVPRMEDPPARSGPEAPPLAPAPVTVAGPGAARPPGRPAQPHGPTHGLTPGPAPGSGQGPGPGHRGQQAGGRDGRREPLHPPAPHEESGRRPGRPGLLPERPGQGPTSPPPISRGPAATIPAPAGAATGAGEAFAPGAGAREAATPAATAPPTISAAAVEEAFRRLVAVAETPAAQPPDSTQRAADRAADRAAVRATFEELAVGHVAPLRNLMLEVRWGEAQTGWIGLARPSLISLRAMAAQIELPELVTALDDFAAALDRAAEGSGAALTGPARETLLAAYTPLAQRLAKAFAIEGERDRREPLIVEALLQQVPGLDPLLLVKLSAVGLSRLENLLRASAEEIAFVAGVPEAVAGAVVEKVAEFQRSTPVNLSTDAGAARRPLEPLLARLEDLHQRYERAVGGWSDDEVATRRSTRRERERAYLALKAALARLGEVDLVLALEKLPFGRRIEEVASFLRHADAAGLGLGPPAPHPHPTHKPSNKEGNGDGRAHA